MALFKGFRRDVRQFFVIWRRASSIQKPFLALSSGAATTEVAAEQLTAGAGQQEGHVDTVVKLPRAGNLCFLTKVSEGTLGLVDYHCRAPFRPSVPWCFPVREVRFFKAICWLKAHQQEEGLVAGAAAAAAGSSAAGTTEVAAEQLTAGAGQQEGHVDTVVKSCQELEICVF